MVASSRRVVVGMLVAASFLPAGCDKPVAAPPAKASTPDAPKTAPAAGPSSPATGQPAAGQPAPGAAEKPFATPQVGLPVEKVTVGNRTFNLDLAATPERRFRGLSGRTVIDPNGGMLFVFPAHQVQQLDFVMRDCPVAIDVVYLDPGGRLLAMHTMQPEAPRSEEEKKLTFPPLPPDAPPGAKWPDWVAVNDAYEARLKKYPSRGAAQFVIELAGGTIDSLGLKPGQKVPLDLDRLKRLAQ